MYYQFNIRGIVQGVGFRPYIFNACIDRGLTGYVRNVGTGVEVVVNDKIAFLEVLKHIPRHARIDAYDVHEIAGAFNDFSIKASEGAGYAEIPPDFFLCDDCLRELNDPTNRRHKHFFITCTNCGPRFSIARCSPYDRNTTSMHEFSMCAACRHEYEDPGNRRYHAQTIACRDCGPRLTLYKHGVAFSVSDADAIEKTAQLIKLGEIVAVKGIGGFHLVSNLESEAVAKLRELRGRSDKPFAVMCRDIAMVKTIAYPTPAHEAQLLSPERAIVLVPKRTIGTAVSELDTIGVMLPYSAFHYLLFDNLDAPIIMTSSNQSDEPMTTHRDMQKTEYVLDHSRPIVNAVDDSVVKIVAGQTLYLRRSRGYVPRSIAIPQSEKTILALGAEMNTTFCIGKPNGTAILSQHMGTTSNVASFERYKEAIETMLHMTDSAPDTIVIDLHPSYATSTHGAFLSEQYCVPLERVQHHRAHAYGTALEHGLDDFVAIVADGLGYGDDGTIWGGEVFHNEVRVGHLEQHLQLGGDSAARHPAKMLFSILRTFLSLKETTPYLESYFAGGALALLDKQYTDAYNAPLTSSCGRVLDAAAYLLGFCDERTYEGRPAMLLEAHSFGPLALTPVIKDNILMTTPLFEFLIKNIDKDKKRLAATVQRYLAEGFYAIASQYGKPVTFSGGCAYNTIMSSYLLEQGVLLNKNVPPGDGGISFGQVAYTLRQLKISSNT